MTTETLAEKETLCGKKGKGKQSKLVDYSCCFSFDDLYEAAFGKQMSDSIRTSLQNVTQDEKNNIVKLWVARTDGRFECQDRLGTDGIVYTAFWAADGQK